MAENVGGNERGAAPILEARIQNFQGAQIVYSLKLRDRLTSRISRRRDRNIDAEEDKLTEGNPQAMEHHGTP